MNRPLAAALLGITLVVAACTADRVRLTPVRPVPDLIAEALRAAPPEEQGRSQRHHLVEVALLEPSIRLDIRYATSNNFLGTPFYSQARAFLQRPAAEALVRAHRRLQPLGYGLLVHDAYRPWYVTKVFWDAVPADKKDFVANPAEGSRHNRGCAVDLTLYELGTGAAVEMPSAYDETTVRAAADYAGGTEAQRLRRALLRVAMEAEGFTVFPLEWWHFDFTGWEKYPLGNQRFEEL